MPACSTHYHIMRGNKRWNTSTETDGGTLAASANYAAYRSRLAGNATLVPESQHAKLRTMSFRFAPYASPS